MIDTIGFLVPVSDRVADTLKGMSLNTMRVDRGSGDIHFEYDNFESHVPSSEHRILWKLVQSDAGYILRVEFSAPKVYFRHNLKSINVGMATEAIIVVWVAFEREFGVKIQSLWHWYCYRCDVCANYIMNDDKEVEAYCRHLESMDYPRRKRTTYQGTGLNFPSQYNTLKLYAKGSEFKAHDKKHFSDQLKAQKYHNEAKKILRLEIELKRRIKYLFHPLRKEMILFKGYPSWYDMIEHCDFVKEFETVRDNLLIGRETMVMKSEEVLRMLRLHYGEKQGDAFHHVYTYIVTHGISETRKKFDRQKVWRTTRALRVLGIPLVSDIVKLDSSKLPFPEDFSLEISEVNPYYQKPISLDEYEGIKEIA